MSREMGEINCTRRDLMKAAAASLTSAALSRAAYAAENAVKTKPAAGEKLFLLRYDTETWQPEQMKGFLEKVVEVHRKHEIPATFFCKGATLELMEERFKVFNEQVKGDVLFDIQDHSYSHIGLGYQRGKPVEVLRADYEKSFAVHERIFGVRPVGISMCGTSGKDGPSVHGFDATEKSRAELNMVASLGVRMINAFLTGVNESTAFINYGTLGHPEIMGFPSAYGDTGWMWRREFGDPMEYILGQIKTRANRGEHIPLMLHDWVAYLHSPDKELTHVKRIVDTARKLGYKLVTHIACLRDRELWA